MPSHKQRCFGAAYHEGSIPGGTLLGSDNWSFSRGATHYIWLGWINPPNWKPLWTNLPKASASTWELLSCCCEKGRRGCCKYNKAELKCTVLWQCSGQLRLSCIEVNRNYNDCLQQLPTTLWLHIILTWAAAWQFPQLTGIFTLILKTIKTSTKIRRTLIKSYIIGRFCGLSIFCDVFYNSCSWSNIKGALRMSGILKSSLFVSY